MSARCQANVCEMSLRVVCDNCLRDKCRSPRRLCLLFVFFFWVSARPRIRFALRVNELFASSDLPDREDTLSPFLGPRDERARLSCSQSSRQQSKIKLHFRGGLFFRVASDTSRYTYLPAQFAVFLSLSPHARRFYTSVSLMVVVAGGCPVPAQYVLSFKCATAPCGLSATLIHRGGSIMHQPTRSFASVLPT